MELSYLRLKVNGLLIGWLQASIDDETAQNSGHAPSNMRLQTGARIAIVIVAKVVSCKAHIAE